MNIQKFMIATILFLAAHYSYAQTAPIPSPFWPQDSVINGSVRKFTVSGDQNYDLPSTFTWTVLGGRLFYDEALTAMAGDGSTVTLVGDSLTNATTIYVVWDVFEDPVAYGYIYVTEVSADGCQKSDMDPTKYSGLNIKIIAPPDIRFLSEETLTCSNEFGVNVEIEIAGFAPFDLKYVFNGDTINWHVEPGEMVDSDFDGKENNLIITVDDYTGTTVDRLYEFELIEAVSDGVAGKVLQYPTHTVYAFVQPEAPVITPIWTDVTQGVSHMFTLDEEGVNPDEWFWELYDLSGTLYWDFHSTTQSFTSIKFDFPEGEYNLVSYFRSENGCFSLTDTLGITVYPPPTIAFADISLNAEGCSAVSSDPDDYFEFTLDYQGAISYQYTYEVYDYNNYLLGTYSFDYITTHNPVITIPNTFINEEDPEMKRTWKVIIVSAINGEGVEAEVLDSNISGGRDERLIIIHPKPVITDDIDFAN